jgi:DNA-binding MarR family transcriptional regulator
MPAESPVNAEAVARLRSIIAKLARLLNTSSSDEGLTPTQASVLALVAGRGPLGLAELAQLEGLNPTMLSRVVSKLDTEGLIRRRPDPADQRAARVEVTEAGQRVHDRIRAMRARIVAMCLDSLSPEVTETILAALPALEALAEGLKTRTPVAADAADATVDAR